MSPDFPFAAVVGHADAKLALLLAAADPGLGGVLLRGHKGSAKTTLARGLAALMPDGTPFVELPLGATEDRVVGSVDVAQMLITGESVAKPGLLAQAHGGVLYVDEINLLADHLVDVLLDAAASGINRVEREGVSWTHPSRFVLIGSMNPEEGELRPQLLDRFGLSAEVGSLDDPDQRADAVTRRLAFESDPEDFSSRWSPQTDEISAQVRRAGGVPTEQAMIRVVCRACADWGVEGLRGDLSLLRAAAALAGLQGRARVGAADLHRVAPLALAHRRRHPFAPAGGKNESGGSGQSGSFAEALEAALESGGYDAGPPRAEAGEQGAGSEHGPVAGEHGPAAGEHGPAAGDDGGIEAEAQMRPSATGDRANGSRAPDGISAEFPTAGEDFAGSQARVGPSSRVGRPEAAGWQRSRQNSSVGTNRRGRVLGDQIPADPSGPAGVAVTATARAAVTRAARTQADPLPMALADVREPRREHRPASLVVLVVDASGSMGVHQRLETAKTLMFSLLMDAYQRRDRVALVTFSGSGAEVVLRPTASVEVARARVAEVSTGGRTPLAAGLRAGLDLALAGRAGGAHVPRLVVVTDGRATAASPGQDPLAEARSVASEVVAAAIDTVVIDTESGPTRLGLATALAHALSARVVTPDDLDRVSDLA
ncbi:MAG: ATP-binding protein [Acidimicrobiales bacterium]